MCLSRRNGCSLPEGQQPAAERCADVSADQAAARRRGPGAARAELPAAPGPPARRARRSQGGPAALLRERQHAVRGRAATGSMAAGGALTGPPCRPRIAAAVTDTGSLLCLTLCHICCQLCRTRLGCLPSRAGRCPMVLDLAGCAQGGTCRPCANICCTYAHLP